MVLYTLPPISIIAVTIQKFWFCPLKLCFSIKTIVIGYYSRVAFDGVGRVCFYGFGRHSINSANCGRLLASTSVSFIPLFFQLNNRSLWIKELKQYLTNLKYFIFVLHCNRYSSWHW